MSAQSLLLYLSGVGYIALAGWCFRQPKPRLSIKHWPLWIIILWGLVLGLAVVRLFIR